jgi:hypothetical protein
MGHNISDRLVKYWMRAEKFFTYFYLNTKTLDHYLHILHYLQVRDNGKTNWQEWWQLWQTVKNKGSFWYSQYCTFYILQPFWTFGDWQVIVIFQWKVAFKQYIPKKNTFQKVNFKLCDTYGYTRHASKLWERQKMGHTRHHGIPCYS